MPLALNFLRKEHFDSVATMLGGQKELFLMFCRVVYLLGSTVYWPRRSEAKLMIQFTICYGRMPSNRLRILRHRSQKFLIFLTGYFKNNWFGIYEL